MNLVARCLFTALVLLSVVFLPWFSHNASFVQGDLEPWSYGMDLQAIVERSLELEDGYYGVAMKHLVNGEQAYWNGSDRLVSASLYKLAVLYAAFKEREQGNLSFDESLLAAKSFTAMVGEESSTIPTTGGLTVGDAVFLMITISDNDSAELLLQRIRADEVNRLMREIGLKQTEIGVGDLAMTSSEDMLILLEEIYRGTSMSWESRQEMLEILLQQAINDRLPRYLPLGTQIAHKTGNLDGVRNDAGIVFGPNGPYIIVVMAQDLFDPEQGADVIASLSKSTYDYFNQRSY